MFMMNQMEIIRFSKSRPFRLYLRNHLSLRPVSICKTNGRTSPFCTYKEPHCSINTDGDINENRCRIFFDTPCTTTRAATGAQEGTGAQERCELWWRPGQGEGMVSQCYYMGEQFPKKSGVSPMQDDHGEPVTLWCLRQKLQGG